MQPEKSHCREHFFIDVAKIHRRSGEIARAQQWVEVGSDGRASRLVSCARSISTDRSIREDRCTCLVSSTATRPESPVRRDSSVSHHERDSSRTYQHPREDRKQSNAREERAIQMHLRARRRCLAEHRGEQRSYQANGCLGAVHIYRRQGLSEDAEQFL